MLNCFVFDFVMERESTKSERREEELVEKVKDKLDRLIRISQREKQREEERRKGEEQRKNWEAKNSSFLCARK